MNSSQREIVCISKLLTLSGIIPYLYPDTSTELFGTGKNTPGLFLAVKHKSIKPFHQVTDIITTILINKVFFAEQFRIPAFCNSSPAQ